jgi:hypothetical protein
MNYEREPVCSIHRAGSTSVIRCCAGGGYHYFAIPGAGIKFFITYTVVRLL